MLRTLTVSAALMNPKPTTRPKHTPAHARVTTCATPGLVRNVKPRMLHDDVALKVHNASVFLSPFKVKSACGSDLGLVHTKASCEQAFGAFLVSSQVCFDRKIGDHVARNLLRRYRHTRAFRASRARVDVHMLLAANKGFDPKHS